jgi:serine/threonine protein kinase
MVQARLIGGKYELVELAGEGGMATVYKAVMRGAAGFTRTVAVKKIKPEFRAIRNYIDMFVEEARVGSDLAHPNIVQVYDFCTDEQGSYYLVMEWVEGIDLGHFVKSYRDFGMVTPWPLVAAIGIGTLRGLGAAHERRHPDGTLAPVVHRDVSPHNVLLASNGIVKLTDFGLARARDRVMSLTAPGTVKGKLSYLSPEVTLGQPATPLSDVFALGSVIWEALAAQRLFEGRTDLDVFKQIRNCEIKPLAAARPDIPAELVLVIERALQREPEKRYSSARQMALALADVLKTVVATTDLQTALGTNVVEARKRRAQQVAARAAAQAGPAVPPPKPVELNAGIGASSVSDDQPTWTYEVPATVHAPAPKAEAAPTVSPATVQRQSVDVAYGEGQRPTLPPLPGVAPPASERLQPDGSVDVEFSEASLANPVLLTERKKPH